MQLRQGGFSLIELMVGLTIIGVVIAAATAGLQNAFDAEIKDVSNRLSSTIRYLYNKAATERIYLRIVYNLDEQTYHVEESYEPFLIASSQHDEKSSAEDSESENATSVFEESDSFLLKPVKLGSSVFFKDIQVSYLDSVIEDGLAYTYFMPNGFATPTMINLRDDDDETHYSLEVLALSGRVRIRSEHRELSEEFRK